MSGHRNFNELRDRIRANVAARPEVVAALVELWGAAGLLKDAMDEHDEAVRIVTGPWASEAFIEALNALNGVAGSELRAAVELVDGTSGREGSDARAQS